MHHGAVMAAGIYVGTSGFAYDGWQDTFYRGVPRARRLEHCARHFSGIEINGTFYRPVPAATFAAWRERTPAAFAFAIKGHRLITHQKRLRDVDGPVMTMRDAAAALGEKLRAVLWQLPARFAVDMDRLRGFVPILEACWPGPRHVLELRHRSWFTGEVAATLAAHRVAVCLSDAPDFPMWDTVTTDLVYVRLHGHTRKYASSYSRAGLRAWAGRARAWQAQGREVHIYFDNDREAAAPENALTLLDLLRDRAP